MDDFLAVIVLIVLGAAGVGDFTTPVIHWYTVAGVFLFLIAGVIIGLNIKD